jgi:hypothetical protein
MTASTSVLPRETEVQSRIEKIRAFSRRARTLCAALFGIGLVATAASLIVISFTGIPAPQRLEGTPGYVLATALPPWQARSWLALCQAGVMGVGLAIVFQFYRLFGSLASGAIYTTGNVRLVRRVGLLLMVSAVLGAVVPALTLALAVNLTEAQVVVNGSLNSMGQTVSSFVAGGLVLLASWIMDVGFHEKEHADELRRDADLMI